MSEDVVTLSETVKVADPKPFATDPLTGMAVKLCLPCGKLLCDPYPVDGPAPEVTACHGIIREDYAPSVVLDPHQLKLGQLFAIRGEPMDHVHARTAKKE